MDREFFTIYCEPGYYSSTKNQYGTFSGDVLKYWGFFHGDLNPLDEVIHDRGHLLENMKRWSLGITQVEVVLPFEVADFWGVLVLLVFLLQPDCGPTKCQDRTSFWYAVGVSEDENVRAVVLHMKEMSMTMWWLISLSLSSTNARISPFLFVYA